MDPDAHMLKQVASYHPKLEEGRDDSQSAKGCQDQCGLVQNSFIS